MNRSKAQVAGQHTTIVFAPVKRQYKPPKACPAEIIEIGDWRWVPPS